MSKTVGESRRSQLIGTFGVGSMFPAPEQSLMICGIDHWYADRCPEVSEPRLAKSLGVSVLRSPSAGRSRGDIPVVRFPRYYFCPDCRRLDVWKYFDTSKKSPRCPRDGHVVVPSRFVVACKLGHISDFPYYQWVHPQQQSAIPGAKHNMKLVTRGETSSLSDIEVRCSCGVKRTMEGTFAPKALLGVSWCQGNRPWLPGAPDESCQEIPKTLQRGSSGTWFANLRSAISIPPWSEVHKKIRGTWSLLKDLDETTLRAIFTANNWIPKGSHWTVDELIDIVKDIKTGEPLDEEKLRRQEYDAIRAGHPEKNPSDQFVCNPVTLPETSALTPFVEEVREVSRLREVTALTSFSRLLPTGETDATAAKLSQAPVDWLPAVEVFGEGIFVKLTESKVDSWTSGGFAQHREGLIRTAAAESFYRPTVSARLLLLHSFAHSLMNELSMDAGYPVASLRERIYADDGQAGVLIYTATADSAGSLGGLCAQTEPERLTDVVRSAMRRALWCTSDPVCIESRGSGIDNLNLSACHACLLVPETSCEHRNTLLDRALLVGTPSLPNDGFLSELTRM
jgi:hypothetical protein